ncbi:MAG: aminotransferase class I/II-fold pyridoxal phosphate-dependent enzyme [Lentisphaeria bacterium]|nr:aminotransferase class I/II-fold pyridoxal phosphate-dependent enzyme [Lentisphaeria bacterium]
MNHSGQHPATAVLHAGPAADPVDGATVPPIVSSTAYGYGTAEELENVFAGRAPGYVYSRLGNPTVSHFERRIAALEQGIGAVACASGMAAIAATVLALAGSGDEIISGNSVFGGTYSLFRQTLARYGIVTRFVEATDPAAYRAAITDRTKLIFVETIGNPKLDVPDLAAIAAVAAEHGVVLAVDNTVTTPFLLRPGEQGANLVIHSTSKFLNGHGTAIGGIVVDTGTFDWSHPRYAHLQPLRRRAGERVFLAYLRGQICRDLGCCLSPYHAFLTCIGIDTLGVRMERHCANALKLAQSLNGHPRVLDVRYPGLPTAADYATATRQFTAGYGALLTLRLEDKPACFRFLDGLHRIRCAANLGDTRTLAIHPASTFCRDLAEDERRSLGVTDGLVRISVGIEHGDDILEDLAQSLANL